MLTTLSQMAIDYRHSPLTHDALPQCQGPTVGTYFLSTYHDAVKDVFLYVQGIQHCLLLFAADEADLHQSVALKALLQQAYPELVKCILVSRQRDVKLWDGFHIEDEDGQVHQHYAVKEPMVYLIRPDKYLGFRSALANVDALRQYLHYYA